MKNKTEVEMQEEQLRREQQKVSGLREEVQWLRFEQEKFPVLETEVERQKFKLAEAERCLERTKSRLMQKLIV